MQLSQADAYFDLAVKVIGMAISASDLRSWWESERAHRKEYGLSDQQIDDLIHVCKEHVELLEDERSTNRNQASGPGRDRVVR